MTGHLKSVCTCMRVCVCVPVNMCVCVFVVFT